MCLPFLNALTPSPAMAVPMLPTMPMAAAGRFPGPAWTESARPVPADPLARFETPAAELLILERTGKTTWRATGAFVAGFELDARVPFVERSRYEYRQWVRSRLRFTRDGKVWESLPVDAAGDGWCEDGDASRPFGRRPRAPGERACTGESYAAADATAEFGSRYRLERCLERTGDIPAGAVALALDVEVRGQVVEVSRDPETDALREQRTVATRQWICQGQMTVRALI